MRSDIRTPRAQKITNCAVTPLIIQKLTIKLVLFRNSGICKHETNYKNPPPPPTPFYVDVINGPYAMVNFFFLRFVINVVGYSELLVLIFLYHLLPDYWFPLLSFIRLWA